MVEVNDIHKSYGRKNILKGISFAMKDGTCTGIIGVNGAGKSTLLSILSGISKPDCGTVLYDFNGIRFIPAKDTNHLTGYVPQNNPLIEDLTCMDNLRLWYCNSTLKLKDELDHGVLKMLGIDEFLHTKVKNMSGGMKKRLSIGIAVADNPSLLILDEPGSALDILCRETIRNYLTAFKNRGGSIIIVTHDEDELALCDDIYIMNNGILDKIPTNISGKELCSYLKASSI